MVPVAPLAQKKSEEIKTRSPTENVLDTQFSRMAFCFNRATDLLGNLAKRIVKRFWQGFRNPVCQLPICIAYSDIKCRAASIHMDGNPANRDLARSCRRHPPGRCAHVGFVV
jgi:hypothetical protein